MFSVFPGAAFTMYRGQSDTTGPSAAIVSRIMKSMSTPDGSPIGRLTGDDFDTFTLQAAGKYHGAVPYTGYIDSSNTITQLATGGNLGLCALATDATDNDEVWLQPGSATSVLGAINHATAANRRLVAFESRFKVSSVSDNVQAVFVGLGEEGLAASGTKATDTGLMADKDYIGFDTVHGSGTNATLNLVYNKASGAGPLTKIAGVKTLTADSFVKVGFVYDPDAEPAKRIKVFVDGSEQSTYISDTDITNSTYFPDAEELNFLAGTKNGSGTAATLTLDWWYAYFGR